MRSIQTTQVFDAWFEGLKDRQAAMRVQVRIDRAERASFGDVKPVGDKSTQAKDIKAALHLARQL